MSRTGKGGDGTLLSQSRPEFCEHGDGCTRRVVGKNADFLYVCSVHMRPEINRPHRIYLDGGPIEALPALSAPADPIVPRGSSAERKNNPAGAVGKEARAPRPLDINPNPEPGKCKIIGCVKDAHSRGLCAACYMAAHSRGLLDQVGDPERLRGRNGFFREVEAIIRDNPGITWKQIMENTGRSKPEVGAAVGYLRKHGRVAKGAGSGPYYGQCFISGTEPY